MKRSRFQILLVAGLLVLLGVLAALQYFWLGQISEAEKDRMTRRLQIDTQRFAEDFNREIQGAYLNFQTDESLWQKKDWAEFNERYEFWLKKTSYPKLIKGFYYFENKPDAELLSFQMEKREFLRADWTDELQSMRAASADPKTFRAIDEKHSALVMTVYEAEKTFDRILIQKVRKPALAKENDPPQARKIELPAGKGFLVIELDKSVIETRILPDLAQKHFPEGDFNVAVTGSEGEKIFATRDVNGADSSVRIFDLKPDNMIFFANRELALSRTPNTEASDVIVNERVQTVSALKTRSLSDDKLPDKIPAGRTFQFELKNDEKPRTIIQSGNLPEDGIWTLNVQHAAGSLEGYITNTRHKNLAVSFGILGLLAVSIVLIFVSAYRARVFAQRQIDFVSSVSHEFRTPLAVIYSAGENLADGVAKEETQVSRYGNLIKNEGKKLSKMVEQILEFAGANSGKKKYDFREHRVTEIVENALDECRALIDEKGFAVEQDIAENLPFIKADANALSQAIQNLIFNSLKYSNGEKFIKISAQNGGGRVKISVEDKGIGIAPADLKHIFEPFYRAKAVVDEQIHGNGLGLSLVKETVEAHGGKISAKSEIGKGSQFVIHLPFIIYH
jgi:signal transduction histidine kinase